MVIKGKKGALLSVALAPCYICVAFSPSTPSWPTWRPTRTCMRRPRHKGTRCFAAPVGMTNADERAVSVDVVEGPFESSLLRGYWTKQPLLVRNAFNVSTTDFPTWDDILSLAVESAEDACTRLISHKPGQWETVELDLGPFETPDHILDRMNKSDARAWTLLVNDVDRYMPGVSDWMDQDFGFLKWRRDDAQVSLARKGGGIGPHVDNYDVFLVQVSGVRDWGVGKRLVSLPEELDRLLPEVPVRILQGYEDDTNGDSKMQMVRLHAGDMLYLPPRVVHQGTAVSDDCMTLSVGCRTPSAAELTARVAESVQESIAAANHFVDASLLIESSSHPSPSWEEPSLTTSHKEVMKGLVRDAVENLLEDDLAWDELVGRLVTEAKRYSDSALQPFDELVAEYPEYSSTWGNNPEDVVERVIHGQGCLFRTEGISFATSHVIAPNAAASATSASANNEIVNRLYGHGEVWEVSGDDATVQAIFGRIAAGKSVDTMHLSGVSDEVKSVLADLLSEGLLYASEVE